MDEPLQFERRAGYANGDVIRVSLQYEELHRYCFTCKRVSHEEGTCPNLTPTQREENRITRLKQKEMEELAAREAFSLSTRGLDKPASREMHTRLETNSRTHQNAGQDRTSRDVPARRSFGESVEQVQRSENGDLYNKISIRRDTRAKDVWNRLDHQLEEGLVPRDREKYHPYQCSTRENLRGTRG
ncbi:hypothetical protein F2Q70_00015800 [Brassica cretica]|uniref:Zinc knuckle CX2CX4HX4C domain-containing protein n=1 Tax=Brassica cretica TaxID=69181 RepID=A0A8S9HZ06_BRACR|nr:hypothetical protein F2Q70_00015800 [Brassica cretica]